MKYEKDPVVEEVREVRQKIFKEFNYNPHSFGRFLAEREKINNKKEKLIRKKTRLKSSKRKCPA